MQEAKTTDAETGAGEIVPEQKKKRIFFPNLDGLRFFSYAAVFFFHIWLLYFDRYEVTGASEKVMRFLFQNGEVGVNFFFVLSGFLISYLLIEEKKLNGRIHIVNFWIRRILRIWPLFYAVVVFGLIVYPQLKAVIGGEEFHVVHPWTYFVFANNFDFLYNGAPAMISILWSVAIEEQYYICWPVILSLVPLRKFKYVFLTIMAGSLIFRFFHYDNERILLFHTLAVIGDMALGGLCAYYVIFSGRFQRWLAELPKWFIVMIYVLTATTILFRKDIFPGGWMVMERIVFASLFGLIILEQNFSSNSFYKIGSYKRVSRLGIYTYGLYCIHVSAMTATEIVLGKIGFDMKNAGVLFLAMAISFFLTVGAAWLSYHFYEKQFLRLKDRFAFIVKK